MLGGLPRQIAGEPRARARLLGSPGPEHAACDVCCACPCNASLLVPRPSHLWRLGLPTRNIVALPAACATRA
eukprot:7117175-Lingulodinium_polyedra.AAC.1